MDKSLKLFSRSLLCSLLLCCACSSLFRVDAEETLSIDRIRLIWTEDPAQHAIVAWDGEEGTVAYAERGAGALDQRATLTRSTTAMGMNNRFVHLNNLKPNQAYELEIVTKQQSSKRFWFLTAPNTPAPFSFIAGGDSRNHKDARCNANLMVSKLRPLFVAFDGDMTSGDTAAEWQEWFKDWELTTGTDGRLIPIIAARGNHERMNESISNLFNTPHPSIYYASSIGGDFFRIYTLNSEIEVAGEQKKWLADDLAQHKDVQWKLAQYHKPMWPHVSNKAEGPHRYRAWAPLFYEYGFNMVIECDSHCVKTTWPIRPSLEEGSFQGFVRDDLRGTVFVGEGCWGAPIRNADDNKPWTRDSGSFNQFKWVHVHTDKMEIRTIPTDKSAAVTQVDDSKPFTIPEGLEIWSPTNGDVVTLLAFTKADISPKARGELKMIETTIEIKVSEHEFKENTKVEILCTTDVPGKLHYTIDGSSPTKESPVYSEIFTLSQSTMIQAVWVNEQGEQSIPAVDIVTLIPEPIGEPAPLPQVQLGSLTWLDQSAGYSKTQINKNISGKTLRIRGITYEQGLGMHALGHVSYSCDPSWKRFVASTGLDDQVAARYRAKATIEIYADDTRIYQSPQAFNRLDLHHINVEIPANSKVIKIVAGDGGNGPNWDNVDLVNAGFLTE